VFWHNPFDLDVLGFLFRQSQVVLHLHPEPHFGAAAEGFGKPDGHLRGNNGLAIHKIVESLPGCSHGAGGVGYRNPQRLNTLLAYNAARMRRVLHARHGSSLMIVLQINILGQSGL